MTLATRTRSEQIGDIITALEHVWKMYPQFTFDEVLDYVDYPIDGITDDAFEQLVRTRLQEIMKGGDDTT